MKRIVSVSLGTSKRDKFTTVSLLGDEYQIERRGTDGDEQRFVAILKELDGKVDAIGLGGADLFLVAGNRRYTFSSIKKLISILKVTPIVDGSGLKHTLERKTISTLQDQGVVDFKQERVLLVNAVDRYGMAQALDEHCPNVVYGDFLFGVGLPIPLRKYSQVELAGRLLLPIITKLPLQWFYPTGAKQEVRKPSFPKYFSDATFICGDWHYIRRYAPDDLSGKTILTQTLRKPDLDWLKSAGLSRAITTTPIFGGETFATNVMEALIVAHLGKPVDEISEADMLKVLADLNWSPQVIPLNP
ncbi:MAG: hypothetical protein MUC92_00945 [Fimbriimonadaceae bacterium]|jgi:hypothetical protein|nr:hypothetical protein [Fimbriimonadaceae bacterium]